MIGVDWGTTSLRAYRYGPDRAVAERRHAPRGLMQVTDRAFEPALRDLVGDWLAAGERHVLLCGMIGSQQGWREAPYLPCPAGLDALAAAIVPVDMAGAEAFIVPGLRAEDATGVPEIMRGEETQLMGLADDPAPSALVCLPGTHAKWATLADGAVTGFSTAMTGEVFGLLRHHSILGRVVADEAPDDAAFDAGVARAREPGGLLHHLFGARTLVVTGRMAAGAVPSYLSGLTIGHEVEAALAAHGSAGPVHLVGEPALARFYARALEAFGVAARIAEGEAAARGLARIGERVRWT